MLRAISTVGLSELETRVAKATYADDDPPKPKHVDVLLRSSRDYELVSLLEKRLNQHKWNVVLKALVVIHRISLDGSERFIKDLAHHSHMFNLGHFMDVSTVRASGHSKFIRVYSEYLAEKAYVYKLIGVSNERRTPSESQKWAMKLPIPEVCRALPCVEDQFEKLLLCHPSSDFDLAHPIPISAVALLIKDAFRLYSILTVLMLVILEKFESMSLEQTKLSVKCAARFLEQNERFKKWTQRLATMGFVQQELLPNFDTIPSSFISLLKEHLHFLETGDTPPKKKKSKAKKPIQAEPEPELEDEDVMEMRVDVDDEQVNEDDQEEKSQPIKKIKPKKKTKGKASIPPPEEEIEEPEQEEPVVVKKKIVKKKKNKKSVQLEPDEEPEPEPSPQASSQATPRTDRTEATPRRGEATPRRESSTSHSHSSSQQYNQQQISYIHQQQQVPDLMSSFFEEQKQNSYRSNPNDLYSQLQASQQQSYPQQQQQQSYQPSQTSFFPTHQHHGSFSGAGYQQPQQTLPYYSQQSQALVPYGQQPPAYTGYGQPSQPSPFQMFQAQGTQSSYSTPASQPFVVTRADPFSNLSTARTNDFTSTSKPTITSQSKPATALDTINPFASFSTSTSRTQPLSSRSQSMAQQQQATQPAIASFDPFANL